MKKILIYITFLLPVLFTACKSGQKGASANYDDLFKTDLTKYRVSYHPDTTNQSSVSTETGVSAEGVPEGYINSKVDEKLGLMAQRELGGIPGYRLLIFSGTNRRKAEEIISNLKYNMGMFDVSMEYEQPNYKVKAGTYFTKLDAHADHVQLKKAFPSAILVSERINLAKARLRQRRADSERQNQLQKEEDLDNNATESGY
ncbi:hypothetical protein V6R21_30815 [Limibacter armeniacum]|uniref:hypothetical protein n=1 Tax=Limibacter armeniacum TaxID=466084 RepID=UPI002FE55C58